MAHPSHRLAPAFQRLVAPPLLAVVAFGATIVAGLTLRSVPPLVALNTALYHAINGLSCGATPQSAFYRFMWTGFNQTRTNYIVLYSIIAGYVLLRHRQRWPQLLFVGVVIAALGYVSNPIIWHWAWGPRPFTVTDACILYPQYEPDWSSYSSFPSGHARETAAEITALIIFWRRIWPVALAYLALLDFSRIYIGVHFPFDVLAGTILGWAIARIAFFAYDVYLAPWITSAPGHSVQKKLTHNLSPKEGNGRAYGGTGGARRANAGDRGWHAIRVGERRAGKRKAH